jgi:hypothetical protein
MFYVEPNHLERARLYNTWLYPGVRGWCASRCAAQILGMRYTLGRRTKKSWKRCVGCLAALMYPFVRWL